MAANAVDMVFALPSTGAGQRPNEIIADRIIQNAELGFAIFNDGKQYGEGGHAIGEVEGAINRIDNDSHFCTFYAVDQLAILFNAFLPDQHRMGPTLCARCKDELFRSFIRHR